MYERYIKRILDIIISFTALIVLSPLMIILSIVGIFEMKGNPYFTQDRPGYHEKIFKLLKFRSMTEEKDENGEYLPDEQRLTKYGEFLRSTSLDELPQLINVLVGDMSLIGPRPLLIRYLPRYNAEQKRRHNVRPGITGLAMSKVRNGAGWDKKFELDIEYVDNISFWLDVKIIFWTIKMVISREGINEDGFATNSEFWGIEQPK